MNDCLFEMTYQSSEKNYREVYRYLYFFRPLQMTLMILILGVSALNVYYFFLQRNPISLLVPVFGILMIAYYAFSGRRLAALRMKREAEMGVSDCRMTLRAYDDGIQMTDETGVDRFISFESFSWAHKSKHLILLMTKAKLMLMIPQDAFVRGASDQFLRFLFSKGLRFR